MTLKIFTIGTWDKFQDHCRNLSHGMIPIPMDKPIGAAGVGKGAMAPQIFSISSHLVF